jgi:hypothetical protein
MTALRASLAAFDAVLRNRAILLVELAFAGFSLAEWATWIAMLVYAYGQGGAPQVGLVVFIQLAPAALLAPLGSVLGDRYRRDAMLLASYAAQAVVVAATAVTLGTGGPTWLVYGLAALANATMTLTRPLHAALLPYLAETPAELTAANVATGATENLSILVGPALAGLALGLTGPGLAFAVSAAILVASALLVMPVLARRMHVGQRLPVPVAATGPDESERPAGPSAIGRAASDFLESVRVIGRRGQTRTLVWLIAIATLIWGAQDVLIVVLALDLLRLGEPSVGYLNSIFGAGGVVGVAATFLLIGRPRLAVPFAAGMVVFGAPLLFMGFGVGPLLAGALLAVSGAGRSVMDVAGRTLLQRVAPHAVLARVFGVLEGISMAALAIGSVVASAAIAVLGDVGAFAMAGLLLPAAVLLAAGALREMDTTAEVHLHEVELLRDIPIFAPLSPLALERLAASLAPASAAAGEEIVRQGEPGDRYYVLAAGRVEVLVDGRRVRELGPGGGFGEIALLRQVPRTATVRAMEASELLTLERAPFLETLTGYPVARVAADAVIADLLGAPPGPEAPQPEVEAEA